MKAKTIPYKTDDTDLAAFIFALSEKEPTLDRTNERVAYSFELTREQFDALPKFYSSPAPISIPQFSSAKKKLLRMLRDV